MTEGRPTPVEPRTSPDRVLAAPPHASTRSRQQRDFSEDLYQALMKTPFWAISVLFHAILYLVLFHLIQVDRPAGGTPMALHAVFQEAELEDAMDEADASIESTEIVDEPELDPDFADSTEDNPAEETPPLVDQDRFGEAFQPSGGASAGELRDLGFSNDIWGTDFGEYLQALRTDGLDVVFVFDSTSSMADVIGEAKRNIVWMISLLQTLVPRFRLGIATYRDYGDRYVVRAEDLTRGRYRLMTYLDTVEAGGGGDIEEAVLAGLESCTKSMPWQDDAKKVIILIGDAPPHRNETKDCINVARAFHAGGGTVHTMLTFPPTSAVRSTEKRAVEAFHDIALRGGGAFTHLGDAEDLILKLLVLSFGERWRPEIESAYARAKSRSTWRDGFMRRQLASGNVRGIVRKLRLTPVYPGLVETLIHSHDQSVVPAILAIMQEDDLPVDNRWAGVYILKKKLGFQLERLPRDPDAVLEALEERHRASIMGPRASSLRGDR